MNRNNVSSGIPGYTGKMHHTTFFSFIDRQISLLYNAGQQGTAQNYYRARNSFFLFCQSRDIEFSALTDEFISGYERWLKAREVTRDTISFYMRILRAAYNKAVEIYSTPQRHPCKHVYTGIEHTRKRAVTKETIIKLKKPIYPRLSGFLMPATCSFSVSTPEEWLRRHGVPPKTRHKRR